MRNSHSASQESALGFDVKANELLVGGFCGRTRAALPVCRHTWLSFRQVSYRYVPSAYR
jgi:hypothetical protein